MGHQKTISLLLAAILVLASFLILKSNLVEALYVPDSVVYHRAGKSLAENAQFKLYPKDPFQYVNRMWARTAEGALISKYPPVFSLASSALFELLGERGQFLLPLLSHVALLIVVYLLYLCLFSSWIGAVICLALLCTLPLSNSFALRQFAHSLSCLTIFSSILFVVIASKTKKNFWFFSIVGGTLYGIALGVRYGNIVYFIPIGLFFLWHKTEVKRFRSEITLFLFGLGLPLVGLLNYQKQVIGSYFKTGYTATGEDKSFSLDYLILHLELYLDRIIGLETGLIIAFAILGIFRLYGNKGTRSSGFFAIILLPIMFYGAYYWKVEVSRFVIPTFISLVILASFELETMLKSEKQVYGFRKPTALLLLVSILGFQMLWGVNASAKRLGKNSAKKTKLLSNRTFLKERIPPQSALFGSKVRLLNFLDYKEDFTLYHTDILRSRKLSTVLKKQLNSKFESKFNFEKYQADFFRKELVGKKHYRTSVRILSKILSEKKLFMLLTRSQHRELSRKFNKLFRFSRVGRMRKEAFTLFEVTRRRGPRSITSR